MRGSTSDCAVVYATTANRASTSPMNFILMISSFTSNSLGTRCLNAREWSWMNSMAYSAGAYSYIGIPSLELFPCFLCGTCNRGITVGFLSGSISVSLHSILRRDRGEFLTAGHQGSLITVHLLVLSILSVIIQVLLKSKQCKLIFYYL